MALFSELHKVGLENLEKMEIFEEEKRVSGDRRQGRQAPTVSEASLLYDKTYRCPVCDTEFHSKMVRTGRIKLSSQDTDLRPKYLNIDPLKYDAVVCPTCGYAALNRFFKNIVSAQMKLIRENISTKFKGLKQSGEIYTYEDALIRHQLALASTVIKKAKVSQRAYTCLKTAWVCRGKAETLPKETPDYNQQIEALHKEELELLDNVYKGFMNAFSREAFPMCGMDELTVTYILADVARRIGKYEESSRWISKILISRGASERIKQKARDVKELLNQQKTESLNKNTSIAGKQPDSRKR